MIVIALCTACFFRAKVKKNFGSPAFRFGFLLGMLWRRHWLS